MDKKLWKLVPTGFEERVDIKKPESRDIMVLNHVQVENTKKNE